MFSAFSSSFFFGNKIWISIEVNMVQLILY